MKHTQHFCFTNSTNDDNKTTVDICTDPTDDEKDDDQSLKDTKMLFNIVGN